MRKLLSILLLFFIFAFIFMSCIGCMSKIKNPLVTYTYQSSIFHDNLYRSVAILYTRPGNKGHIGRAATAWAYDNDHLITSGHFCKGIQKAQQKDMSDQWINFIRSTYQGAKGKKDKAKILAVSYLFDACVLSAPNHGLIPIPILDDLDVIETGDLITIAGAPKTYFPIQRDGRIINLNAYQFGPLSKHYIFLAVKVQKGNSGSPVVWNGWCIGMINLLPNHPDDTALALRSDYLLNFIKTVLVE